MRKYGQLVSLSVQNLIDCTGDYSNAGCGGGGWPSNAFAFAADNVKQGSTSTLRQYGLDTEADYPYVAQVGPCMGCIYPVVEDRSMPLLKTVRREHRRRLHRRDASHRRWTHGGGGEYRTSQRVHRCYGIGIYSLRWRE
jgi:hypothetical protein